MLHEANCFTLTRRGALKLAAGAGVAGAMRLYAAGSDFWNKKEPSAWSSAEIDQLTNKSPWAKEVVAQYAAGDSRYGSGQAPGPGGPGGGWGGQGGTGIPNIGIPGLGGGGGGGGRNNPREPVEIARGTVRWETAKPILEALKTAIPDALTSHYVISVNGLPLDPGTRRRRQDDSDGRVPTTDDLLDELKSVTFLEPKGRRDAQPGVVMQGSRNNTILFGFTKDLLNLKLEDKEVNFSTQFGRVPLKARFVLKDMVYRGDLAL